MDHNITKRPYPLPYPAEPCARSWYAEHDAPPAQPQHAEPKPEASAP